MFSALGRMGEIAESILPVQPRIQPLGGTARRTGRQKKFSSKITSWIRTVLCVGQTIALHFVIDFLMKLFRTNNL